MAQPFNQVIQNISPLLGAMSASYGAGMGPFGYMPQGLAAMMEQQKAAAAERQAAAASAAFDGIVPSGGGMAMGGGAPMKPIMAPAPNSPKGIASDTMATLGRATYTPGDRDSFVAAMMPHALRVSQVTGLDPRLVIAQAAQETGWGKSAPNSNYFGIKSHGKGGVTMSTKEYVDGQEVTINDSFRGYGGMGESADDYARFLRENPRYKPLLAAGDLDAELAALGASGYATDPNYATSVGSIARSINVPGQSAAPQGGPETVQPAGEDPILARLYAVRAVPGLSEGQAHVIDQMIEQRQKAISSSEPVKGIEVDGRIVNPINGEVIYNSPQGQPEFRRATPDEAAAYGAQGGQFGPDGRFYPVDVPQGMTIESDGAGGFRMVQGPAGSANLTVDAAKNTGFLIRMKESAKVLDELESEGTSFWASMKAKVPGGNYLQTPEYQKYDQAKRDFVNAVLRRESGAVIADSEFANADRQYFPQPGDSDAVIAQKRANRAAALSGVEVGAGAGATLDAGSGSPEGQGRAGSTTSPQPDVVLTPDLQSIFDKYK